MIIGLCGRAGAGKSSVAKYLAENYGFAVAAFALSLKNMAMDIWGFSPDQVFGKADVKEAIDPRWGISPRDAMKVLGQAARDHLWDSVWIDALVKQLPDRVVIEDVRYQNEAALIQHELDGIVIRLVCTDSISTDDGTHPSEKEVSLIEPDVEIVGSRAAGLPALFEQVDSYLRVIGAPRSPV